jgi:hypothetical protein
LAYLGSWALGLSSVGYCIRTWEFAVWSWIRAATWCYTTQLAFVSCVNGIFDGLRDVRDDSDINDSGWYRYTSLLCLGGVFQRRIPLRITQC